MYEFFDELLQKYGVTPYKVSKETGVSQSTLSDWKRGISTPKPDKLQKLADYFGVPLSYLLTGQKEEKVQKTTLTTKDERDIAKDIENIMEKLSKGESGPATYDGEVLSSESVELFREELEIALRRLKLINKEKYNPNKNKK